MRGAGYRRKGQAGGLSFRKQVDTSSSAYSAPQIRTLVEKEGSKRKERKEGNVKIKKFTSDDGNQFDPFDTVVEPEKTMRPRKGLDNKIVDDEPEPSQETTNDKDAVTSRGLDEKIAEIATLVHTIRGAKSEPERSSKDEAQRPKQKSEHRTREEAISTLRRILYPMDKYSTSMVRAALTECLGEPGDFWIVNRYMPTKEEDKSFLWFKKNVMHGKLSLVVGKDDPVVDKPVEQEDKPAKQEAEPVFNLHAKLERLRTKVKQIQRGDIEKAKGRRANAKHTLGQRGWIEDVMKIATDINRAIRTKELGLRAARRAFDQYAEGYSDCLTKERPSGSRSVVWWKDKEGRMELVLKGMTSAAREKISARHVEGDANKLRPTPRKTSADVEEHRGRKPRELGEGNDEDMPLALPYTKAASVFLYGSNTVLAALSANRRKFYRLYLHDRSFSCENNSKIIKELATKYKLRADESANLAMLDKMSDRRPHNGVALEASRLPAPPVLGLRKPDQKRSTIPLELEEQSREDKAVNGAPASVSSLTDTWRHPFVLLLDGILDEGNMGNIMRTAHFYGVDAVAVGTNTCASINSPVLAKASSGAVEAVQILALPSPGKFVYNCAKAGWKICAAVAPPSELERSSPSTSSESASTPSNDAKRYITTNSISASSPLAKHPCILMLGAEGEGLRDNLKRRADYLVSIAQGERSARTPGIGVDSVNVGVAAGVLVESFLRKPVGATNLTVESDLGF